jgi:hypothetical protein
MDFSHTDDERWLPKIRDGALDDPDAVRGRASVDPCQCCADDLYLSTRVRTDLRTAGEEMGGEGASPKLHAAPSSRRLRKNACLISVGGLPRALLHGAHSRPMKAKLPKRAQDDMSVVSVVHVAVTLSAGFNATRALVIF